MTFKNLKSKEVYIELCIGRKKYDVMTNDCTIEEAKAYCRGTLDSTIDSELEKDSYCRLSSMIDNMLAKRCKIDRIGRIIS